MNESEYNELRSASWRRKLNSAEEAQVQAYLMTHPEAQANWEEDLALTRHLQALPNPPLSSNFTSLVLQAVDAETHPRPEGRTLMGAWRAWFGRLAPRAALATLVATLGAAGFLNYEYQARARKQFAAGVEQFVEVANLPGPEIFEDFDAIQKLRPINFSDNDLLAALQ
jgi:anti-sigma factor RsiW